MNANRLPRRPPVYFAFLSKSFAELMLCQQNRAGDAGGEQHPLKPASCYLANPAKAIFTKHRTDLVEPQL